MMQHPVAFCDLAMHDAVSACMPLPQRLLLRHMAGTRASRASAAKANVWMHAFVGLLLGVLVLYAVRASGIGTGAALVAGAIALLAWPMWFYQRQTIDSTQLFEYDEWIDFERRLWHSHKNYDDTNLSPVVERIPLDDLMLLCTDSIGQHGWSTHILLCKTAEFDPDDKSWPVWGDILLSADLEQSACDSAVLIANAWRVPCWRFSGASDEKSWRLNA